MLGCIWRGIEYSLILLKDDIETVIEISKEKAAIVRSHFPHACIAKTRHKQYLEETEKYLALIPDNDEAASLLKQFAYKRAQRKRYNAARAARNKNAKRGKR